MQLHRLGCHKSAQQQARPQPVAHLGFSARPRMLRRSPVQPSLLPPCCDCRRTPWVLKVSTYEKSQTTNHPTPPSTFRKTGEQWAALNGDAHIHEFCHLFNPDSDYTKLYNTTQGRMSGDYSISRPSAHSNFLSSKGFPMVFLF